MSMRNYEVTLETPGLYGNSHYYSTVKVRAGSADRAKQIAEKRNGGRAVFCSPGR